MSKFPAKFLSAADVGRRIKVKTASGAVIEDVLTRITSRREESGAVAGTFVTRLYLFFENSAHANVFGRDGSFEVRLESMVKRAD